MHDFSPWSNHSGDPYPGIVNPLDGKSKSLEGGSGFSQYYIKIVPTIYEPLRGPVVNTNQYSYNELFRTTRETDKMPAVYFHYEISPIMAKVRRLRYIDVVSIDNQESS